MGRQSKFVAAFTSLIAITAVSTSSLAATLDDVAARLDALEKENLALRAEVHNLENNRRNEIAATPSSIANTKSKASHKDKTSQAPQAVEVSQAPGMEMPSYNWTGFYLGGEIGAGWGTSEIPGIGLAPPNNANAVWATLNPTGFLGGGRIGFNWQPSWWVLGVEGDFDGTAIKSSGACIPALFFTPINNCSSDTRWLATVSGRVGGVVNDRLLAYAKGGAAFLSHSVGLTNNTTGAEINNSTGVRDGWLLGMGLEYALAGNWSGFVEYDYMEFKYAISDKLSTMKAGVNYRF